MAELVAPRIGLNAHLLNLSGNYRSAGIHWYIYHLVEALQAGEPDFDLTLFSSEPRLEQYFHNLHLVQSRWPTRRPIVRILWEQLVQPVEIRSRRLDLLHAMAFAGPLAISIPWVVTIYDLSFLFYPASFNAPNRTYLAWAVGNAVRRADRVIAISESTRQDLVRHFTIAPEKVSVVYCGRDTGFSPATERATVSEWRAARRLPERMILFVGTLEPRKNIPRLIRAFAQAKRKARLAHHLVLVGARGWKYEDIDRAIEEEGIASDVMLAGYVPQEELANWYRAADLFVYPSLYEGFGLPPLAAMACGTPVVTSNAASLPEVVGRAAITVSPDNVGELADAMILAIADRSRREEMIARGLEQATRFSWERAARETKDIYRSVLAKNRVMTPSMQLNTPSRQNDSGAANASS